MLFTALFTPINIIKKSLANTYKSTSLDENVGLEVTKHVPPANKEWNNSVYSYNKSYIKSLPSMDERASALIKSYFSFTPLLKRKSKSWRLRMSMKRSSTNKIFISKPEIKQTSDKAIITVYIYDRQKQINSKRLYLLRTSLLHNNSFLVDQLKVNNFSLTDKISENITSFYKRKILYDSSKEDLYLKKQMYKHRVKSILYAKNMLLFVYRKKTFLKSLFFFHFMKWALSIFNLKVSLKGEFLISKGEKGKILNIKNKTFSLNKLRNINIILLQYFLAEFKKITLKDSYNDDLSTLFAEFKEKHYAAFMGKYLKEIISTLLTLSKFNSNKYRYTTMVDGLKGVISNLYNKKVELNIVNLKYLHMNSDNFSDAVTTKLRRRKGRLLKVLKKSLSLIKKPRKFSATLDASTMMEKPKYMFNNIKSVLNSIKYKWVTGIRLEARGRLTRRYTASRAVYKLKYKGSLRNLEHLYNTDYKAESPSIFLLRNQFRPNVQHTFAYSKKRIGSFGLKGWISSV